MARERLAFYSDLPCREQLRVFQSIRSTSGVPRSAESTSPRRPVYQDRCQIWRHPRHSWGRIPSQQHTCCTSDWQRTRRSFRTTTFRDKNLPNAEIYILKIVSDKKLSTFFIWGLFLPIELQVFGNILFVQTLSSWCPSSTFQDC